MMNDDLQTKLGMYRERKQLAVQFTALPALELIRILPNDPPLVSDSVMERTVRVGAIPFAALPSNSPNEDRDSWLQRIIRLTPITDHFFLGLQYRYIGWLEVKSTDNTWIVEVARSAPSLWFRVVDSARTTLVSFMELEYEYHMMVVPLPKHK